uniref:Uncharacterized protein n=1 Tax=Arundo donax TaxID=35708 RepID=A0A0A9AA84_ARUDO
MTLSSDTVGLLTLRLWHLLLLGRDQAVIPWTMAATTVKSAAVVAQTEVMELAQRALLWAAGCALLWAEAKA